MSNGNSKRRIWVLAIAAMAVAGTFSIRTWLGAATPNDFEFSYVSFFAKSHGFNRSLVDASPELTPASTVPDEHRRIFIWMTERPATVPSGVAIDGVPVLSYELHEASLSTQSKAVRADHWLMSFSIEEERNKPRELSMVFGGNERKFHLRNGFEGMSSNRLFYDWFRSGADGFAASEWTPFSGAGFPEVAEFAFGAPAMDIPAWCNAVYVESFGDSQAVMFMSVPSSHSAATAQGLG